MFSFLFIRIMALLAGSANSTIAQVVKQKSGEIKFHIGRNIILFGYHIHHFYFGILLIGLAGWLAIVKSDYVSRKKLALMYGAGLGLLMDEIGLLLTWGNYYSSLTYLLGVFLLGIFLNVIYFPYFWKRVREYRGAGYFKRNVWDKLYNTVDRVSDIIISHVVYFRYIIYAIIVFLLLDVIFSRL